MPLSKSSMVLLRPALESAVDIHPSRLELPWFRAYPFYRSQKDEFTLADSLAVVEAQHNCTLTLWLQTLIRRRRLKHRLNRAISRTFVETSAAHTTIKNQLRRLCLGMNRQPGIHTFPAFVVPLHRSHADSALIPGGPRTDVTVELWRFPA
jgi:hypothetical protein